MSETEPDPVDDAFDEDAFDDDSFDEVRQAAGAVISSLKWLIDATERVVEDPAAFARVVDNGRSVVDAIVGGFTGGFADEAGSTEDDPADPD